MSDSTAAPVGVVGDAAVADALEDAGVAVEHGTTGSVPSTDRFVAVGGAAMSAVARDRDDALVLPVDAGRGVRSVTRGDVPDAVAGLSEARVETHPVVTVTAAGEAVGPAFWDVTLVTADAARISEFAVETAADGIGQFRADGVVVATAAGSPEYAHRVGGPTLTPSTQAVVVPIAPFATDPDHWVLPVDGLTLSVERDEATVSLLLDDRRERTVDCGETVTLSRSSTVRVAVVEQSRSRFG